jgi:hypothetical protein
VVALSFDGSTALVGASGTNNYAGAAYVFSKTNGTWDNGTSLNPSTGHVVNDYFGYSVALSGNGSVALVGAREANGHAGAAYAFERTNGTWSNGTDLIAPLSPSSGDNYGSAVALSRDGSSALVGAQGVSGSCDAGAAYVFSNTNGTWDNGTELTPDPAPVTSDYFGSAGKMSHDGSTVIVAAFGVNNSTGTAYVFSKTNGTWSNGTALTPTSSLVPNDQFGTSVALSGDGSVAIVGAIGYKNSTGGAFIFTQTGGVWSNGSALTLASGPSANGYFGQSAVLSDDGLTALVGAPGVDSFQGVVYSFSFP